MREPIPHDLVNARGLFLAAIVGLAIWGAIVLAVALMVSK